jgi:hypothetical protein
MIALFFRTLRGFAKTLANPRNPRTDLLLIAYLNLLNWYL